MMKNLSLIIACAISFGGFAQITTTNVAQMIETINSEPYDSMVNNLGENLYQYIGQKLYLNEYPENFRRYGYSNFIVDYTKSPIENGNVYKSTDGFNSKYENIVGKYFDVIDIIKAEKQKSTLGFIEYFLKLKETKSNDIVYYKYLVKAGASVEVDWATNLGKSIPTFPFIVTGFFEKQKMLSIGQEYIFSENVLNSSIDIATGMPVIAKLNEKWKCVDLTIDGKNYVLSVVVENQGGEKILIPYSSIKGKWSYGRTYSISQAEKYKSQFGVDKFLDILQGKISIGMTKEMCQLSLGYPKSINESIAASKKTEQWVYQKSYLYFEDDILTTIQ